MLTEIRDHGFDDLGDVRLTAFINWAYWNICGREPWPFLEATSVVTLNASGKVTAPTDISKVTSLEDTTLRTRLEPMRLDEFTRRYGDQMTLAGNPYLYYFIGSDLYVYPIPSPGTLTVRYIRVPATLTFSPDSTPILPVRYHDVIVLGAIKRCHMMEDDPESAAEFGQAFEEGIAQMRNDLWFRQYDRPDNIKDLDGNDDVDWLY